MAGEPFPQCGNGSVQPFPHCGAEIDTTPQCGADAIQRVEDALIALEQAWKLAAEARDCEEPSWSKDPKGLAVQFRRCLQGRRDLIGFWINREWIKEHYPLFCQALVVVRPPAYLLTHFCRAMVAWFTASLATSSISADAAELIDEVRGVHGEAQLPSGQVEVPLSRNRKRQLREALCASHDA